MLHYTIHKAKMITYKADNNDIHRLTHWWLIIHTSEKLN